MTHINLNTQEASIRQFFLGLIADSEGSLVELDGQSLARVTPMRNGRHGKVENDGPWTKAMNDRRCFLVDREIDGTLSPEEGAELEILQNRMLRERARFAPLPLEDLRRLHEELLAKAQRPSDRANP